MNVSLTKTALGHTPGDLLIKNALVADVFNGEFCPKDVLIKDGYIAAVGKFSPSEGAKTLYLDGKYLLPGFIDAHIHIESSHMIPSRFGEAVLAQGTTAVVADPHEIANVAGRDGIAFMLRDSKASPADIFFMLPSSVPSTDQETAGAVISAADTADLFEEFPELLGLGEVMNVPGVIYGDEETAAKLQAAGERPRDGHFPCGGGRELAAYAGCGISSDHESISSAEAKEKLANGITLFLREGSSAKNLKDLLSAVNDHNHSRCCFCADDICASDILDHGDIRHCLKLAVAEGMAPIRAVEMATINPARHYGLKNRGAIAPGYLADLIAVEDVKTFTICGIWKRGIPFQPTAAPVGEHRFGAFTLPDAELRFPLPRPEHRYARVISAHAGQLITEEKIYAIDGPEPPDVAKLIVMERYGKNGNIGYGLIEGFGMKRGAIATSIAHDSHNLLILALDDREAAFAAQTVAEMGGGMTVTLHGEVLAKMALPIGGLMADAPAAEAAKAEEALAQAAAAIGMEIPAPFMTLAFMALPVIPKLKLTDKGLFDVDTFDFTPLYF